MRVVLYTKENCKYCVEAKYLLDKYVVYETKDVSDPTVRAEIESRVKRELGEDAKLTFPQLVVDEELVPGGCATIRALHENGTLADVLVRRVATSGSF